MESQIISNIDLLKIYRLDTNINMLIFVKYWGNRDYKAGRKNIRFRAGKEDAI